MPPAPPAAPMVRLWIPGTPRGQARPRFTRQGRAYTTAKDRAARAAYVAAWRTFGQPAYTGPVEVEIRAQYDRPLGHYTSTGALSAEGRRHRWPDRQLPDLDNVVKLALDALAGEAYDDDRSVVAVHACKVWAARRGAAGVACSVRPHTTPTPTHHEADAE